MNKALAFDSSKEHYRAEACIFWCFDARMKKLYDALIKSRGFQNVDLVQVAGGAKVLAEGAPAQDYFLGEIEKSIKLHDTNTVILMLHIDCGAMGGSKSFEGHEKETAHHEAMLKDIERIVKAKFSGMVMESYVADFDGLYRVA